MHQAASAATNNIQPVSGRYASGGPHYQADCAFLPTPAGTCKQGRMHDMNAEQDPVDAALAAVEQNKAAEHAAKVNSALNELDSHIIMLRGMGVNVSVTLDAPTEVEEAARR